MKRILTIVFLLVLNFSLKAQIPQEPNTYGYNFKRVGADSLLWIPKDTLQVPSWGVGKTHISRKGTTLYYWDGSKWSAVTGTSIDTTSLSNRINLKLNISDTALMLTNYVRRQELKDTAAAIRASIGGGSGSTELAHQGLVKNGDYIGLDSNGVNPLTRDVLINADSRKITFENDRGSFVFDNPPYPLARINGTGLSPLFQVDSGGYTRFRIYPKGQIFAGDSINLNLFIGYNSGLNIVPEGLPGNPPGRWNVSLGTNALRDIVNGNDNIAIGESAAKKLISGTHNIAIGTATLNELTTGADNVAIGVDVLANNNNIRNVAIGSYSQYLKTGQRNTSVGAYTLGGSGGGSDNSAFGYSALGSLTTAQNNVGIGYAALGSLTTGGSYLGSNVAVGDNAGYTTNGDWNVFLGYDAGRYSNENNAFYLHSRVTISEDYGKNASMLYGKFGDYGANTLRMNGKFGIHSLNNDAAWMPDSSFHVVGNSWLNGKLRITDGTQSNGYVLTSDANGNASWQAASGGSGVTTVGTFSGSSQTNGASISGSTITFGPADATNPGMVSTGSQTFAGAKELRWKARVGSTTSSATPTINTDNYDIYKLTAQTADITSFTTNLSGTPNDGDILEIQITGTATRNITFGSAFVSSTVTIPTATNGTATLTIIFQYYTTSSYGNNKWVCVNYY